MKKLIQAQINEGESIYCVSSHFFDTFQEILVHVYLDKSLECPECHQEKTKECRYYYYKNLTDFLNDREILEGMIK